MAATTYFDAARGVACTTFALVGRFLALGPDYNGNVGGGGFHGALGDSKVGADVGCSAGLATADPGVQAKSPPCGPHKG